MGGRGGHEATASSPFLQADTQTAPPERTEKQAHVCPHSRERRGASTAPGTARHARTRSECSGHRQGEPARMWVTHVREPPTNPRPRHPRSAATSHPPPRNSDHSRVPGRSPTAPASPAPASGRTSPRGRAAPAPRPTRGGATAGRQGAVFYKRSPGRLRDADARGPRGGARARGPSSRTGSHLHPPPPPQLSLLPCFPSAVSSQPQCLLDGGSLLIAFPCFPEKTREGSSPSGVSPKPSRALPTMSRFPRLSGL